MSFFSWLSGSPRSTKHTGRDGPRRIDSGVAERLGAQQPGRSEDTKNHRHARREHLYVAIRESMTRSGVLSARFKFKVLSLDQQGNTFLVMIDLISQAGAPAESLTDMELKVMRHAMARFDIAVSAVYWRIDHAPALKQPDFQATVESSQRARVPLRAAPVYKTIEIDELAAFKEARLAASLKHAPSPSAAASKSRRSTTKQPDFADTQLTESSDSPGLSATQYGDLH